MVAEGVEAAEVVALVAAAEVAESASALEVAVGVDAQDAAWAGGDLRRRVRCEGAVGVGCCISWGGCRYC